MFLTCVVKAATAMNVELSSEFPDGQGVKGKMECSISCKFCYLMKGSVFIFQKRQYFGGILKIIFFHKGYSVSQGVTFHL